MPEEIDGLLDERPEGRPTPLVAGGSDFNHADDAAERMADGDAIAPVGRDFLLRPEHGSGFRRIGGNDAPTLRFGGAASSWPAL